MVVEGDGCGEGEEALKDSLSEAGEGSCSVALECEGALAAPEDALDALADRREVWALAGLVFARGLRIVAFMSLTACANAFPA